MDFPSGIQGTHFRIRGPGFELVSRQLVFLRGNSDCPVPWKNSNSSPIYPLSPQLDTSGKGAIPSSGIKALMSPVFIMSYFRSFFFSFGSRCGIIFINESLGKENGLAGCTLVNLLVC